MHRAPGTPSAGRNRRPGEPDRRALDAMANAASRAHRSNEPPVIDLGNEETGTRRLVARSTAGTAPRPGAAGSAMGSVPGPPIAPRAGRRADGTRRPVVGATKTSDWRTRWGLDARRTRALLTTVAAAVLVIVVAGIALGLALRSPARPATSRTGASRRPPASHHGNGTRTGTGAAKTPTPGKSTGTTGAAAPTTTTAPPATAPPAPTGAPRLSAVSPSSGGPGRTVVVSGTGLVSSNGEVVAYFGGSAAPTSCSTQTSCTVSVPGLGTGPSRVPLTIVTAKGRSNSLAFSYG